MVKSPYEWKILEWDENSKQINKQQTKFIVLYPAYTNILFNDET